MRSLTKSGLANLNKLYKNVLTKCFILNAAVFVAGAVGISSAQAADLIPTLDSTETKEYLETLKKPDNSLVYTETEVGAISSAYSIEVVDPSNHYFKTFTMNENGTDVTYGIKIKGHDGSSTFSTLSGVITDFVTSQTNTAADAAYSKIVVGDASDNTFSMQTKDDGGNDTTLYFKVIDNNGNTITDTDNKELLVTVTDRIFDENFIGNTDLATGGAIIAMNGTVITDMNGDFIGNYLDYDKNASGGAIYSIDSSIGTIVGNFIGNYSRAVSDSSISALGGAIYNNRGSNLTTIVGDFIGNYANSSSEAINYVQGGAISNEGEITSINGDFIGNYAYCSSGLISHAAGGAIYNNKNIVTITGDFIGNYVHAPGFADGGAIYNSNDITTITGDFIDNSSSGSGGAIYN